MQYLSFCTFDSIVVAWYLFKKEDDLELSRAHGIALGEEEVVDTENLPESEGVS